MVDDLVWSVVGYLAFAAREIRECTLVGGGYGKQY